MNFAKFLKAPFLQNTTVRLLLLIILFSKYFHGLIKSLFYSNVLSRALEQFANIKGRNGMQKKITENKIMKIKLILNVNPIQDGHFWGCSRMVEQKAPLSYICHTYPKEDPKIYQSRDTHPDFS